MMTPPARSIEADATHRPHSSEGAFCLVAEGALLARLRAGEDRAYEELVRAETRSLLAVARRLLRHEEDAQDAVQQAFLSAFRALPGFDGRCRLKTWLHRIVTNAALSKLRAREPYCEQSIDELLPVFLEDGRHADQFGEWSLPADMRLVRHETRIQVRNAIERLPAPYRTVLLLRDLEEFSTEQVAEALGVSLDTVKQRLHRARQALMKLLNPLMRPSGSRRLASC
jgi:RNA polymerase sigma-70 factor, ECF subfamily